MKILWLCSWYPNKIKPYDGDFIQRHAQAVSLLNQVQVFHLVKDNNNRFDKPVTTETTIKGNLTETIIYYRSRKTGIRIVDRVLSEIKFRSLYKVAIKKYIESEPGMKLVHLHVALKAGVLALWIKKKFGIPFIISEHWTGYLPEARAILGYKSKFVSILRKKIFSEAIFITFVSQYLADAVKQNFQYPHHRIIHNVVNTQIFYPQPKSGEGKAKFIHISTMTYQKNVEQILLALSHLKKQSTDFIIDMFVPDGDLLHKLVLKHKLEGYVIIHPEVPQVILAETMRQADALILYSHYETFGCVVIEANASGIPAIVSDLPVFREYSLEFKTALFVPPNDPLVLADTLMDFINNKDLFIAEEISRTTADKFSFPIIGRQFDNLYHLVLNENSDN